jgi:hypothetical protein
MKRVKIERRRLVLAAVGTLLAGAVTASSRAAARPAMIVYKDASCGCCGEWVKHMRASRFDVEVHDVATMADYKRQLRVPPAVHSCHTALVAGYAIEGHVPAADVLRLLRERPALVGLAVPGMVPGSPGMSGAPTPYDTVSFDAKGNVRVFARH